MPPPHRRVANAQAAFGAPIPLPHTSSPHPQASASRRLRGLKRLRESGREIFFFATVTRPEWPHPTRRIALAFAGPCSGSALHLLSHICNTACVPLRCLRCLAAPLTNGKVVEECGARLLAAANALDAAYGDLHAAH